MSANDEYVFFTQFFDTLHAAWASMNFPTGALIGIGVIVAITFAIIAFFESRKIGG